MFLLFPCHRQPDTQGTELWNWHWISVGTWAQLGSDGKHTALGLQTNPQAFWEPQSHSRIVNKHGGNWPKKGDPFLFPNPLKSCSPPTPKKPRNTKCATRFLFGFFKKSSIPKTSAPDVAYSSWGLRIWLENPHICCPLWSRSNASQKWEGIQCWFRLL